MSYAAFNRMKLNQGGLISFNNFLSTSSSKEVSLCFAEKALKNRDKMTVLFEINIDPSISLVPYAFLDKLSYFQGNEKEVLFSMHTVFRIGEIKALDNAEESRFWHVYLSSTNGDDQQLHQLTEHMRKDLGLFLTAKLLINMDPIWRLGRLLMRMGEYNRALIIYEMMLESAVREKNTVFEQGIYYQMSEIYRVYKKDWHHTRVYLRKAYNIGNYNGDAVIGEAKGEITNLFSAIKDLLVSEKTDDEVHPIMAELLDKLNIVHRNHWMKPLGPIDYQIIIDRFNYIGWVRKKQDRLLEACANHEEALKILREHLPLTHPLWAVTYNYIASLHSSMNDDLGALDYLQKALDIQENALQPNDQHLGETHYHLSVVFERLNRIVDAFEHIRKAIDIGRHALLTVDDPHMKQYEQQHKKIFLLMECIDELVL